jgi:hypothetical protein
VVVREAGAVVGELDAPGLLAALHRLVDRAQVDTAQGDTAQDDTAHDDTAQDDMARDDTVHDADEGGRGTHEPEPSAGARG